MYFEGIKPSLFNKESTRRSKDCARILNFEESSSYTSNSKLSTNMMIHFAKGNLIEKVNISPRDFWSADQKQATEEFSEQANRLYYSNGKAIIWDLHDISLNNINRVNKSISESEAAPLRNIIKQESKNQDELIFSIKHDPATSEYPLILSKQMAEILERHYDTNNNISNMESDLEISCSDEMCLESLSLGVSALERTRSYPHVQKLDCGFTFPKHEDFSKGSTNHSEHLKLNALQYTSYQEKNLENSQSKTAASECITRHMDSDASYKMIIVDCRYHYEYRGSHIKSAINISSPLVITYLFTELKSLLFQEEFISNLLKLEGKQITIDDLIKIKNNVELKISNEIEIIATSNVTSLYSQKSDSSLYQAKQKRIIPVFVMHCEFSSKRGPKFYKHIRNLDRLQNIYPQLSYPQLYVLKGGFEQFYIDHPSFCTGEDTYRPMVLQQYRLDLKENDYKVANEWHQLKSRRHLIFGHF